MTSDLTLRGSSHSEVVCTGAGDNGGHCCWIKGQVCEFLTEVDGIPRCSIWDNMKGSSWKSSPVGLWFRENYPGKTCRDWPQNIPEVMERGVGLCCWSNRGDVG